MTSHRNRMQLEEEFEEFRKETNNNMTMTRNILTVQREADEDHEVRFMTSLSLLN